MADDRPEGTRESIMSEQENRRLKPVLEPGVIKAFVAGILVGNVNKGVLLGFAIGALAGMYVQQNFPGDVPDIVQSWKDLRQRWTNSRSRGT